MLRSSLVLAVALAPLAPLARPALAQSSAATETCIAGARDLSRSNNVIRNDDHEMEWRAPGCEVRIRFRGQLRFADDYRSIAALERDGSFRATEDGAMDREVEIRPGEPGGLRISYRVDGREQPFDAAAQAWLESVLLQLFQRSAYAAEERVQWMLRRAGPEGVLAELTKLEGDYARHAYSAALLEHAPDAAVQARVLDSAAAWASDYYKTELLEALGDRATDARVERAAWSVARSLGTDYYAVKGVQRLLALGKPSAAETEIAIGALDGIESDYYRAELLKSIARDSKLEGRLVPLFVRAAERTESDYYRAEMLSTLVDRGPIPVEHLPAAIRASSSMKSEHYRAQALAHIARRHELTGDALQAYMAAADAIRSQHYRNEAVRAVRRGG